MNRIVTAVCLTFCVPALVTGEVSAEENGFVTLEGIVDTAATSAEPGAVPATLADGSSILDWKAEPKAGKTPHVYTVGFKEPVAVGTVVVYGKCRLSYEVGGRWSGAAYNGPSGHRLRFIPLPPRTKTTAVRITVEPQMITRGNQTGLYGSSVVFFGILSRRRVNVAANAAVVVSSAGEPSKGFQPVIGLNQSWALVDGVIDRSRNFYSRKREEDEEPISEQSPEWIMLAWENEQEIAGLMLGRGSSEKGLGNGVIETYVGKSSPRFALGEEGWQPIGRDFSEPMKFRSLQMLDLEKPARTRAVRVKSVGGVDRLSVGEVIALVDLEEAPAPVFFEKVGGLKGIPFEIPGPGKVTIQVRDAEGNVVANPVAGEKFPAGKNIAGWDLKTIDGDMILTPGSYSWRGLYNPGLLLDYKFTYYPYPVKVVPWHTPDKSGGWLADHEAPKSVARQGDTMWLGAFAESGDSIIQVDTDMNKLWGEYRIWLAEPGWVCADGEWMFYLAEGGWMGDRQVIIQVHGKTHRSRRIFVRDLPQRYRDDVNGFQVVGNKAFISGTKINSVRVYDLTENLAGPWRGFGWKEVGEKIDAELPRLVKEIPLEKPGRVRKYGDGKVITTSGNDLVLIDVETYEVSMLMEGKLTNPMGLGVDDKLNIYVGEGDPLHQVVIYSPDGRLLKTLGTKGRREIGPFDEDNLDSPSGVEVGPLGRVWVAEHTDYPKRVSVWDVDTGKCVKAVYGPTQYGGGGCIDPGDDSRMFYKGIEFRRDRKTGEITIPNLLYRPDSKEFADFDARNFPSYAFRAEGKLWFTSAMAPHGHSIQVLWQYKGDRVQPVAANGGIGNLKGLVGEEFESFFRNKVLERVDPVIDFNWRGNPPGKGLDKDNFSARWKGRLIVPKDGEYIFYTVSTDGARLHIDAELLIDNWRDSGTASTKTVIRNLKAGSHDILVEYYERDGNAEMKLEWEGPDIERQAIPKEALRATAADDAPVGLTGTYFNFGMAWLEKAFPQRKENEFIFTWTDLNDNGFVDGDEVRFGKPGKDDKFVTSCGVGWNWLMNANFLTATGASGPGLTGLIYFRPKAERSKHGYPIFDLPKEVVPQAGGQGMMVDLKGNVICLTGPVKSVSPEGKINWRYINEWPGLHAGHGTTARGDEPGVLIAPCRFFGSAWINDEIGEVIVFNSNLGCTYLMTADDGLFIERGFRDTRVGLLWRMPQPPTPEVMTETSLSDEHFGGTFQKCKDADGKEHLYYVAGKPHSSVVELLGLEKVKRLPGGKFEVTAEDIAAAALRRQQQMARQAPPKVYAVHRSRPDEVKIDGRADEWPKERMDDGRQGSFALACDDANLYVLFTGRDDRAVFKNGATNFPDVFKHGDVVDVKLQTRAGLKPNRSKAGRGDIRLSFAMFEGKPVCILYDFDVEGIDKGMPFSSPWRTEWINKVVLIPEASISVNRERNTYVLEASVPLKLIHLDPTALGQTRGDVGRVLSDQTGSAAAGRVYWANKNTHIVSDLPSEAALQPSLWGMFVFEKE